MKQRRYKNSYRIVTDVDPKTGRPRETAEYAGDLYAFPEGSPPPRARALRLAAWPVLYWALALLYLRTAGATGRCMYALVPFIVGLIPGAYALMGLLSLAAAPTPMTVVRRENGPGRMARALAGCGGFAAIGALGCAACLSAGGLWRAGWHEPLLCAAASAAAWIGFAASRRCCRALVKASANKPTDA